MAEAVEKVRPEIVSFHFGLPELDLLDRVKETGEMVFGNATSRGKRSFSPAPRSTRSLLQGAEAGGHSGCFLTATVRRRSPVPEASTCLCPNRGGRDRRCRRDRRGILAGASAVQFGTAYLASPESVASTPHRALLGRATETVFTNLFSGREARGLRNRLIDALGPINPIAPPFPHASAALAPLRARAEADGRGDYSPFWAGTAAARVRPNPPRR